MRQQNNGRRRQNRGSNRRNYNNGALNGNINKNTVIDSSGPDGRQRGSVAQLNEKYTSLASDASSSDDRILAESENKESKLKTELNSESNNSSDIELEDHDKISKKPSRRKRGFQMREAELSSVEDKTKANEVNDSKKDKNVGDNLLIKHI